MIKSRIAALDKEHKQVRKSYYNKHIGHVFGILFFLVPGALSIVASPLMAVSWLTIGAGFANSYRKVLKERRAKLDSIEKEKRQLQQLRRIDVSDAKQNERNTKISHYTQEETNELNAVKATAKARKYSGRIFAATAVAGLIWPIPFAIAAPLVLAYKASKDSDCIKHTQKMEAAKKQKEYYTNEVAIANEAIQLRAQRRQQAAQQAQQAQAAQQRQQTQRRQATTSTPIKSRNEQIVSNYIDQLANQTQEYDVRKQLIKK